MLLNDPTHNITEAPPQDLIRGERVRAGHRATVLGILGSNKMVPVESHGDTFKSLAFYPWRLVLEHIVEFSKKNPRKAPTLGDCDAWAIKVNAKHTHQAHIILAETGDLLTRRAYMALIGGGYHEAWHILYTGQSFITGREIFNVISPRWDGVEWYKYTNFLCEFENILEDIRIERLGNREFPGAYIKLCDLQDFILSQEQPVRMMLPTLSAPRKLVRVVMNTVRDMGLGYNTNAQRAALDEYKLHCPEGVALVLKGPLAPIVKRTISAPKSDVSWMLAGTMEALKVLIEAAKAEEQPPQPQPQQGQGKPQKGQGQGKPQPQLGNDGSSDFEEKQEQQGQGQSGKPSKGKPSKEKGQGKGQGQGKDSKDQDKEPSDGSDGSGSDKPEKEPKESKGKGKSKGTPKDSDEGEDSPDNSKDGDKDGDKDSDKSDESDDGTDSKDGEKDKPEKKSKGKSKKSKKDKSDDGDPEDPDEGDDPEGDPDEGNDPEGDPDDGDPDEGDDPEDSDEGNDPDDGDPDEEGDPDEKGDSKGDQDDEDGTEGDEGENPESKPGPTRTQGEANNSEGNEGGDGSGGGGGKETAKKLLEAFESGLTGNLLDSSSALTQELAQAHKKEEKAQKKNERPYRPYTTAEDRIIMQTSTEADRAAVAKVLKSVKSVTSYLRAHMKLMFRALDNVGRAYGVPKGQRLSERDLVDTVACVRGGADPRRAFMEEELEVDTSIAAALVLDESGSMSYISVITRQGLLAVCESMDNLGAKVRVAGFQSGGGVHIADEDCRDYSRMSQYHRSEGVNHHIFKKFDERFDIIKGRFNSLRASGGTPMSDGIQLALDSLNTRKEAHKIVFVFTDGCPDGGHEGVIRGQCRRATEAGVLVIGVGLGEGASYVEHTFPDSVYAENLTKLPNLLVAKVRDLVKNKIKTSGTKKVKAA